MEDNRKVRADSEAFEAFVSEAASDLLRSAFVLTGDRHLSEDLVQETFIRLARHWTRVAEDGRSTLPYARKTSTDCGLTDGAGSDDIPSALLIRNVLQACRIKANVSPMQTRWPRH